MARNSDPIVVVFSPDNRLLAAGFGGKNDVSFIELWDIDRRERLAVLPGSTEIPGFTTTESTGLVSGLTFSSDGKHLVAGFGSLQSAQWWRSREPSPTGLRGGWATGHPSAGRSSQRLHFGRFFQRQFTAGERQLRRNCKDLGHGQLARATRSGKP